jgi:hypothetical protein
VYKRQATVLLFSACEYRGRDVLPSSDDDSDRPEWAGGDTDLNPKRKQNDNTGEPKGEDYGDLYVLKRLENGVPEMGVTSLGIWYPKVVAFDVDGMPVMQNGYYVTLSVNDEGDINDENYDPMPVDFGRMSLVRSPESVLSAGLDEAIVSLLAGDYITTDFCGRLVAVHGDLDWLPNVDEEDDKTIDSPRENLAIYRELMRHGFTNRLQFMTEAQNGFTDDDLLDIAASALAAGSDKTGQVILDEVINVNQFLNAFGDGSILLQDIPFYNEYSYEWEYCDDPYYSNLYFYNYNYEYDRNYLHGDKWVKITKLNPDGTYTAEAYNLLEVMEDEEKFTNVRIDNAHNQHENVAGFTQACDDAVQILEYIHESSLVEYLGRHASNPMNPIP